MIDSNVEELLTEILPRKISLSAPEDADRGIPELIAFWEYLKREYKLAESDAILSYLRSVKPEQFRKWMNDPSRFGMAKSFFMMGQNAGFDMTDEKESNAFLNLYNANLLLSRSGGDAPPAMGPGGQRQKNAAKAKRTRKIAKESRRKNRKRK